MINRFEIKNINGEERLYLYLNFDFEFGSIGDKKENKKIIESIDEFIVKNNITFKGSIISLVVGGILIGNLVLNRPIYNKNIDENITPKIIEVEKLLYVPKIEIKDDKKEIDNIELIINENIENKEINNKNTKFSIKQNSDNNINKNNSTNINLNDSINHSNNSSNTNIIETKEKEAIDNNTYVKVKRSNGEIITIELEEYLIGVVGAEMPALFHEEALKAQSVIARTYALKSISQGKILTDTESTQSYKNNSELKSLWGSKYDIYYNKIKNAVNSTKGEYLTYNGTYIDAVYHSTSNGRTENSSNVWNNYFPYLVSVDSKYDSTNPSFIHEIELSYEYLSSKLGTDINNETNFNILGYTEGNRIANISINDKNYTGVEFRNILSLRSASFEIENLENGIKIITKGYGHGVGMSQYGANGMAKHGYSYKDILKHYYQGVVIKK